ncbi:flagellar protein FlaI [Methanobrevibacter gottschalkii]|uniref:Flagellar protein FlaI n=2 Tax=Methanobrevibacter gottschalkii TaxID=190974 RepID=A0A3N5C176_9EURY|nr:MULTISPECIES: CpaF family protein [Methanobrevibacter]MCQ2970323.1 CpaF family protein [archaeon]OEC95271.1 secretion protein [Methanobrevibacter sp. A27]RPF53122.1 flagellar protein FlaI [Methanobrevibacter gottschalkii DSM 11977]SEK61541.1 flagellar protein FlaI [Methanobrevibacter gottschalkii]
MNNNGIIPQYDIIKQEYTSEEKILLGEIRENLVDLAISTGENFQVNETKLINNIKNFLFERLNDNQQNNNGTNEYLDNLSRKLLRDIVGYGEIDPLIQDDELEEIMIIGINKPVFVYHRKYGMMKTNITFNDEQELIDLIDAIARQINRRIDQESPILDGRLIDGSRINATIPPISADGPSLTIRKFKKDPLTIIDLIKSKTISVELAAFFWLCFDGLGIKSANAIISGGTSSGKTTTLNALSAFINPKERIITIEDTLELQIPHEHVIRMETRPSNVENKGELTMNDLVKNSLRQRPDRIIVGEVRAEEAITLFTALNTGHSGFGTLHSNDARETITRLTNEPMSVPKIMIQAIDFIIMQNRIYTSSGVSFRRISEVAEVVGIEEGVVQLNKIFQWNPETDTIDNVSISSKTISQIANLSGKSLNELYHEIEKRELVLKHMVNYNIRSVDDVTAIIELYYKNPEKVLNNII